MFLVCFFFFSCLSLITSQNILIMHDTNVSDLSGSPRDRSEWRGLQKGKFHVEHFVFPILFIDTLFENAFFSDNRLEFRTKYHAFSPLWHITIFGPYIYAMIELSFKPRLSLAAQDKNISSLVFTCRENIFIKPSRKP